MRRGVEVSVSPEDRVRLSGLVADRNTPQKHAARAQIVLLTGDCLGTMEIMRRTGQSKPPVWRWPARYAAAGVDGLLRDRRYLLGDQLTAAAIRLLPSLMRFAEVYATLFKCNRRRIADCPVLLGYTRDVYQLPGIADTIDFRHIRRHYYGSLRTINPAGIVPIGPARDFDAPHDRDRLSRQPTRPRANLSR